MNVQLPKTVSDIERLGLIHAYFLVHCSADPTTL